MKCTHEEAHDLATSEGFEEATETYLDALSTNAPDSTFYGHQTALNIFVPWCRDEGLKKAELRTTHVGHFADYLFAEAGHSTATISGHLSSLSNFLAFLYQSDPALVKHRIATALHEYPSKRFTEVWSELTTNCESTILDGVDSLLSYLRTRQFGTRTHVFAELVWDTKSRPKQIRQIDISALDLDGGIVLVGIPETHVVSDVGLVTHRTADLSSSTVEAIETYLNYERNEVTQNDCRPLFTTSNGRASPSTLRRSVKRANDSASNYASSQNEVQEVLQTHSIAPADIRDYAISTITDQA
ncbi:tyrosine-type recombinase/integrase [Halorussus lipolyticus]|uniref:tyrosine-type recombinase/integrase n=1 Tax=Halorussus lipolyticus TaxID=3034024 RepID=UPI0023E78373|nr:tyrosine-type recombinase/integrase [Halorussus sp. DT80]